MIADHPDNAAVVVSQAIAASVPHNLLLFAIHMNHRYSMPTDHQWTTDAC